MKSEVKWERSEWDGRITSLPSIAHYGEREVTHQQTDSQLTTVELQPLDAEVNACDVMIARLQFQPGQ